MRPTMCVHGFQAATSWGAFLHDFVVYFTLL